MRIQCKKPVTVRGKLIGGPFPMICLPLVAKDLDSLEAQARELVALAPDIVEWRIDGFDGSQEIAVVLEALSRVRRIIGEIPLIFTCRIITEGGFRQIPRDERLEVDLAAVSSGNVDILDTELSNDGAMIVELKDACRQKGVKLMLSFHDFGKTPDGVFILDRLSRAQALGADIAKAAVMPKTLRDVLTLLEATFTARSEKLDIPIVTMSMGEIGAITRVAGGLFGADITFAVGRKRSAPGQIPVEDLRAAWGVIPGCRYSTS